MLNQSGTITTVGVDVTEVSTNWTRLNAPVGENPRDGGAKGLRLTVTTDASLSTNTQEIFLVLVDENNGSVLAAFRANCTAQSDLTRTTIAGTGGNYLAVVSFDETSSSFLDLCGQGLGSVTANDRKTHWRIGAAAFASGIASVSWNVAYVKTV